MGAIDDHLKWYSTFVFLIGTILSFADPITDALTLAEFYKAKHRKWFTWGVIFMFIPCLVFVMVYLLTITCDSVRGVPDCFLRAVFACNPFSPAIASLKAFVLCLKNFKKLWRGEEVDYSGTEVDNVRLLLYAKLCPFMEAIAESIPQFIIQLYVASVQEEPVKIIQIISLIVSCLSLVWTFAGADEFWHDGEFKDFEAKIKHKVMFCLTYLLLITGRLFAICYFIMTYRGWIFFVLMPHSVIIALIDCSLRLKTCTGNADWRCLLLSIFFLLCHWIRDDLSAPMDADDVASRKKQVKRIQWLSHIMFVAENFAMILLFYHHPKSLKIWFSLPVTVYVCVASILGSTMRLVHYHFLLKNRVVPETYVTDEQVEAAGNAIQQELMNAYAFVQAYQLAQRQEAASVWVKRLETELNQKYQTRHPCS